MNRAVVRNRGAAQGEVHDTSRGDRKGTQAHQGRAPASQWPLAQAKKNKEAQGLPGGA